MIYYTVIEGGAIAKLNIKSSHQKIIKQLYNNRNANKLYRDYNGGYRTHLKITSIRLPYLIHSVFFVKNGNVTRIWDATTNGYRPKNRTKGLRITW